jgi:hypothetical protein
MQDVRFKAFRWNSADIALQRLKLLAGSVHISYQVVLIIKQFIKTVDV